MKKTTTKFPEGILPLDSVITVKTPKPLGLTAKSFIWGLAVDSPLYDQPIKCDTKGQSEDGKEISVDTVGRWFFGVPGYYGRLRIVPIGDQVAIYYLKKSPQVAHDFLADLKKIIENKK